MNQGKIKGRRTYVGIPKIWKKQGSIINHAYIESGEYRGKSDKITSCSNVNHILYFRAFHRNGTLFEDMYWIDADTGGIVAGVLDGKPEGKTEYSEAVSRTGKNPAAAFMFETKPITPDTSILLP